MRTLQGLRIVVTRAAHQAEELAEPLRALGAGVILLPVIGIAPPLDTGPLHATMKNASSYDWVIFTSANAVSAFAGQAQPTAKLRAAAIGSATREAAESAGFSVELMPEKYVAESLVEAFAGTNLSGRRILIPSAAVTRDVIPPALRKLGAHVDVVEAYRNVIPTEAADLSRRVFQPPYPDWVTFTSSSAVDHLIELTGRKSLRESKIATIGPVTSKTVRKYGLEVSAEAAIQSVGGIVEAVLSITP
jgi:uroporphyrinogen-III synthase